MKNEAYAPKQATEVPRLNIERPLMHRILNILKWSSVFFVILFAVVAVVLMTMVAEGKIDLVWIVDPVTLSGILLGIAGFSLVSGVISDRRDHLSNPERGQGSMEDFSVQ